MDSPLTIFVCATRTDLMEEREEVLSAIEKLELQHDSMEFFGARPDTALETCLNEVRRSDVLIVIVSHLYGSQVPGLGISYSEAEYNEGYRLGKHCLPYLRDENAPIFIKDVERDEGKRDLLTKFKGTLRSRHTVSTFCNPHDLALQVVADLRRLEQCLKARVRTAVEKQIDKLKQGHIAWNAWRSSNPIIKPDLRGADLRAFNLSYVDLSEADLSNADLSDADLSNANLSKAILAFTNLTRANLVKAHLGEAFIDQTIFANMDLSETNGMDTVRKLRDKSTSTIGFDTIYLSRNKIPDAFLLAAGISVDMLSNIHGLKGREIELYKPEPPAQKEERPQIGKGSYTPY